MKQTILFISSLDISGDRSKYDGVTKKILLQISTLNTMGYLVDYIYVMDNKTYLLNSEQGRSTLITDTDGSFHHQMKEVYTVLPEILKDKSYDYIYVRYEHISLKMTSFFSSQKKKGAKIIAELPTYMGKWEPGTSFKGKIKFIGKRLFNVIIKKNIDKMVTFSDHKRIYGIPTICVENFADVAALPVKEFSCPQNEVHFLGVAMMTPSHGFDRVITGLADYYSDNPNPLLKVYFHVVGNGTAKEELKRLVVNYKLEDYVIFEGIKQEKDLDCLFNSCQIGVASLAIFRKKCSKASELKIREYISRGLPFIYSAHEPFIVNQKFAKIVPHDNTPINIKELIVFYENLYKNDFRIEMRKFAEMNCTCRPQMKKIFK